MSMFRLAWKSLFNRRMTAALTLTSIALSVTLLIGVEKMRQDVRESFSSTISGTDLIVGARSGGVQLLLYSVFRIGNATNNISWESYQDIAGHRDVAWTIPFSLGDSHRGYRVLGTTQDYFKHFRFSRDRGLEFDRGQAFMELYDAVLGAEVAEALAYQLDEEIIIAHGAKDVSFARHDDKPFKVVGILERTGTPVDRTVHVSLAAIEAIHAGWESGAPPRGASVSAEQDLTPKAITAALLGLNSRISTFRVQRFVNDYAEEPLTAILPGVALSELWGVIGIGENALLIIAAFVVVVSLFGMLTVILTSLNERRREMAILRSVGARPGQIFVLIMGEATALTLGGIVLGIGLLNGLLLIAQPILEAKYGIHVALGGLSPKILLLLGAVTVSGFVIGAVPSYRAYRMSLADGLSIRV